MRGRFLLLLLGAALAGSGCVGSEGTLAPTATMAFEASGASDTGVSGTVHSDELAPIVGAVVQVGDNKPVLTGADGRYEVVGLEPGPYRVVVQAIGYSSVGRMVDILAGEIALLNFELELLPVKIPRVDLLIMDGYDICSYATPTFIGTLPNPCPLGQPVNDFDIDLEESWRYLVVEVDWETSNSFWLSISDDGNCNSGDPCFGVEIGAAPLRIQGAPQDAALAARWALDGKEMYPEGAQTVSMSTLYAGEGRELLNSTFYGPCGTVYSQFGIATRLGCALGVGYSTGIRFKQYVSIFQWERPDLPYQYSALPDE
jgi:hypothetical protein